ncbi:hypothetical protein C0991_002232 [Blastosporella zonata]|nr:hypothetical protein C0991_002232 [Blastosporella zonata]
MATTDYGRPFTPCSTLHDHYSQSSSSHTVTVETRSSYSPSDKHYSAVISYPGEGTSDSPYIVDWVPDDAENPYNWSKAKKWVITMQVRAKWPPQADAPSHVAPLSVGPLYLDSLVWEQLVHRGYPRHYA